MTTGKFKPGDEVRHRNHGATGTLAGCEGPCPIRPSEIVWRLHSGEAWYESNLQPLSSPRVTSVPTPAPVPPDEIPPIEARLRQLHAQGFLKATLDVPELVTLVNDLRGAATPAPITREWLNRFIDRHGVRSQLLQTVEELAEMIVAINKVRRSDFSGESLSALAGEAADVYIMVNQVFEILRRFDIDPQAFIDHKIQRAEMYLK